MILALVGARHQKYREIVHLFCFKTKPPFFICIGYEPSLTKRFIVGDAMFWDQVLQPFVRSFDRRSIKSFRHRSFLFIDILIVKFSNPVRRLKKTKKASAILAEALKKEKNYFIIFFLYATTTLHFNAWTRMEFPLTYDCLKDSKQAKD